MGELSSYSVWIFFYVYVSCIKVLPVNFWQVCPKLKKHVHHLLSSPSIMLKTWAKYVCTDTHTWLVASLSTSWFLTDFCVTVTSGCSPGQKPCWEHWCQRELTAELLFSLSGKLMRNVRISFP